MLSKHREKSIKSIVCAVVTVSDTRTKETDLNGKKIKDLLNEAGHQVFFYEIVPENKLIIQDKLKALLYMYGIEAIIFNGGTGISHRDVTIESIEPYFDKKLPGFGELFRQLSFTYDIGSSCILLRATAGITKHRAIFSIPGSIGAVTLAMEKIIIPELGHIVFDANKHLV